MYGQPFGSSLQADEWQKFIDLKEKRIIEHICRNYEGRLLGRVVTSAAFEGTNAADMLRSMAGKTFCGCCKKSGAATQECRPHCLTLVDVSMRVHYCKREAKVHGTRSPLKRCSCSDWFAHWKTGSAQHPECARRACKSGDVTRAVVVTYETCRGVKDGQFVMPVCTYHFEQMASALADGEEVKDFVCLVTTDALEACSHEK